MGKAPKPLSTISASEIERVYAQVISGILPATPLTHSEKLSNLCGREIWIKWESAQQTGSFKERGASYFLSSLSAAEARAGVIAASAGNHALALSYHAQRLGIPCTIVMPRYAPLVKVKNTEKFGAKVILDGETYDQAKSAASALLAQHKKLTLVPAFDHEKIIIGQGTCAVELVNSGLEFDAVVVPVGGGGLISGIATYLKARKPGVQIIGVQSDWALKPLTESQLLSPASLADGIAVKRPGELTSPIVRQHVDQLVSVSENEIADAIMEFLALEKVVVEGAAAAALAGILKTKLSKKIEKMVLVLTGSNIDLNVLGRLIERHMSTQARLLRVKVSLPDRPGSLALLTQTIAECQGNVLRVLHDRSFSDNPGNVSISVIIEVQDPDHSERILAEFGRAGLPYRVF